VALRVRGLVRSRLAVRTEGQVIGQGQVQSQGAAGMMDFFQAQAVELAQPLLAKLQAQVGLFLADKDVLLLAQQRATTAPQLERAQALYAQQLELEQALGQVLPAIQAGTYDLATVTTAATLYARIDRHHQAVNDLRRELGLPAVSAGVDWSTVALWGGGGLALLGAVTRSMPVIVAGGAAAAFGAWRRFA